MAARNNFKSGSCEMLVLHILKEYGDCYAYQLSQYINKLSEGEIHFPEGSFYPTFYKLLEKKYISDYKKIVGRRMTRIYYHIEPEGEQRLNSLITEFYTTIDAIKKILTFDFSTLENQISENNKSK